MLTSRRPNTLRLYDFYSYWRDVVGNYTTLPQYFKQNGYYTYSIGKIFHTGRSSNYTDDYPMSWSRPTFHSVTEKYMNAPVCINHIDETPEKNLLCAMNLNDFPDHTLPDIESTQHAKVILNETYRRNQTFFIALGYHKPHVPFMIPYEYLNQHDIKKFDKPNFHYKPYGLPNVAWNPFSDLRKRADVKQLNMSFPFGNFPQEFAMKIRQHYYASITFIDDLIGEILQLVNYSNTIVVLTSDHGWSLGKLKKSNFKKFIDVVHH